MLVYGDRSRPADPAAELRVLRDRIADAEAQGPGLERHAALVACLITCGELAQGLTDAAFEARGEDAPDPAADLALDATRSLADAVVRSWREDFAAPVDATALQALSSLLLPERVTLKEGEGFAFYALYPETYAEAAASLAPAATTVVGLRSIGTTLGAVAATALGAERFVTVRPVGDPFRRTLRIDPSLQPPPGERVVVVDEGPGLSGSSFGATLDWVNLGTVSRETLAFPSHTGALGPEASPAHRARWARAQKRFVSFDDLILPRLPGWVSDLTGTPTEPLQDLSGGTWRALRYPSEADWPAANAGQERRKFLLRSERGAFLLKFAGLGAVGERKLARARRLAVAGFTPEPLGLRHGFLVESWLAPADPPSRSEVLDRLGPYLRFRAQALPAEPAAGASVAQLLEMMVVNVGEGLGSDAAQALGPWRARAPKLAAQVRRVATDNRLQIHEWVRGENGRPLKTDALDHAQTHDLVGCQDVAWDVAGAAVELEFTRNERDALWSEVGGPGRVGPDFLAFHHLAYLAFQLGACTMAAQAHGGWPEESARLSAARDVYAEKLRRALQPA